MLYDSSINKLGGIYMEKIIKFVDEIEIKVGLVGNFNYKIIMLFIVKEFVYG